MLLEDTTRNNILAHDPKFLYPLRVSGKNIGKIQFINLNKVFKFQNINNKKYFMNIRYEKKGHSTNCLMTEWIQVAPYVLIT